MATSLLLADDSPTISKILGMALASEDYQIRSVLTADEAVRELKANPPFFFLVDLTLPGKNGFEFAQMIRADKNLKQVKIVLLSSAFEPVDQEAVAACGADLVIAKPFDPAELRTSLRNIKDAPPKFPGGAKVQGALSGFQVTPSDKTRTNVTDTNLHRARQVIGTAPPDFKKPAEAPGTGTPPSMPMDAAVAAPAPEELLQGLQAPDQDADSILAGLAENAPAPGADPSDLLGGAGAAEDPSVDPLAILNAQPEVFQDPPGTPLLDLTEQFGGMANPNESVLDMSGNASPADGTAMLDLSAVSPESMGSPKEDTPPPFSAKRAAGVELPKGPITPPSPPRTPEPAGGLSANAQALAAFFSAEIDSNQPKRDVMAPPEAEFEKSMASIEWDNNAPSDLDSWSSGGVTPPSAPPASAPAAPAAPVSAPKAAPRASTDAPPAAPPRAAAAGASAVGAASGGGAAAAAPRRVVSASPSSMMFDTGGSSFRFAEDYIHRITKSFVGHPDEPVPQKHAMFPVSSDDVAPSAPAAGPGVGAGGWNPVDSQKMEQIIREEVQMAVREVVEKVAWEVIPELAENLIKKELEKVMKQIQEQN